MSVEGAGRVMRKLSLLDDRIRKHVAKANQTSGQELIRIARVLHVGDGENKAAIDGTANADGSYLCDFGPKSKVTEGENAHRPFVNPAKSVVMKRHKARARRALSAGIKEAMSGG